MAAPAQQQTSPPGQAATSTPTVARSAPWPVKCGLDANDLKQIRQMVNCIGVPLNDPSGVTETFLYRLMTAFIRRLIRESISVYIEERNDKDIPSERELKVLVAMHVAQAIGRVPDFDFLRNEGYIDDDNDNEEEEKENKGDKMEIKHESTALEDLVFAAPTLPSSASAADTSSAVEKPPTTLDAETQQSHQENQGSTPADAMDVDSDPTKSVLELLQQHGLMDHPDQHEPMLVDSSGAVTASAEQADVNMQDS